MSCGARNGYDDVCGETYTCPTCMMGDEVDSLRARIDELERVLGIVKETLEKRFADRTKWFEVTGDDGPVWAFDWTNRPTDHDHPAEIPEQALDEIKSVLGKGE